MINALGGINGRKINLISYDDASTPPKTVEQVRKLVEGDEVLFTFQTLGNASNIAVQKYLNDRKIPQLFVAGRATRFEDPVSFPWTMGMAPNLRTEIRVYARYILDNHPNAKIGLLYQNDEGGKDYVVGLKEALGAKAAMLVAEAPYEPADPTGVSTSSIGATLVPAGLNNSKGLISASSFKEAGDPTWADDDGMKKWVAFMDAYYPEGDRKSIFTTYAYSVAELLVHVLRQCGDDISRANIMRQATNLKAVKLDLLLPGLAVNTSPTDYRVVKEFRMMRFTGERWEAFGPMVTD
jgi:ABC-type branched-subunit amino acid transport system substrate-binding protein